MRCPWCSHTDSKVVDSRDSETGEAIRRRRECLDCGRRFTTYERVEAVPLLVVKKDGRREEFDRQKLLRGLSVSVKKRDIGSADLERIVDSIESGLRARGNPEVPSREVGEMVMTELRALDEVAYIRFASVYRSFKDVNDWRSTIEEVLSHPPGQRADPPRRPRARRGRDELELDLGK